jgi:hypothetical protein
MVVVMVVLGVMVVVAVVVVVVVVVIVVAAALTLPRHAMLKLLNNIRTDMLPIPCSAFRDKLVPVTTA